MEPLGEVLGASWEPLRSILETFWGCLGMILELGQRFRSDLLKYKKNIETRCKVLQKSRFRGSEIYEKLSLEGNLKPKLMLSWLVKVQVGAKRAKLTRSWRLRGTKLELKGSLGTPLEALRERKRATRDIDPTARGAIFEPRGFPYVT